MNYKSKLLVTAASLLLSAGVWANTRIAILTDTHVSPGMVNEQKLIESVSEINKSDCDIVIVSGDLTNQGSNEELINVKAILDRLILPTFYIPGNHENNWSQSAGNMFPKLWGSDRFVTQVDSFLVVGINCGPYMKMGDGHIKQEDLIWLRNTLETNKEKPVISVNHYPLQPDDLDNYEDYMELLHNYKVVTHLCGHYHQSKYYKAGDIDCLFNRALDMRKGNYGYSIIEISADSIKQWDKHIGEAPILANAFAMKYKLQPYKRAVKASQTVPGDVKITKVYADNASIFTIPVVDKTSVYVGNSLGYVKSIDKITGKVNWEYKTAGGLFSRMAVADKYLIVPTSDNRIVWLNKSTGDEVASFAADGPYVADGVVAKGVLYQGGYNGFQAWSIKKKKLLWSVSTDNYCQAAPVVDGNDVIFGAWDTKLRSVNSKTGKVNWSWNNGKSNRLFSPGNVVPVVTKDKVIIVAPDRFMTAINRSTGETIWRNNSHKFRESLGCSADGKVVYAKTMDGEVVAVSAVGDEYNELWCIDCTFGYEHAPCTVCEHGGVVYAASRKGKVSAINPDTKKLIWTYDAGSSEGNGWAEDESGDLYLTLIEGAIIRISKAK